mgnify:CR=1 FL=1
MSLSRRRFLHGSAATAASAALWTPNANALGGQPGSPNDRIRIGAIGVNGMGFSNVQSLLKLDGVEVVALADVDQGVLERRAKNVEDLTGGAPKTYGDYRALLDDDTLDAVVIGTPDHWHCLQMVDACSAGKDVYVEKPLANSIHECQLMMDAARTHQRVVQCGQWQRSGPHWAEAIAFVHSGTLGRIRSVRSWAYMNWLPPVPDVADASPPAGVDYDRWLGPAPKRPFNENRFHFNFRWFHDYAGGLMTDWGVHIIDIVLWGMQATAPRSVVASGGKFAYPDDAQEWPDTMTALYEFDDFLMTWEHATGIELGPFQRAHGVAFVGNNGTLVVDRQGWELYPEEHLENRRPVGYKMPGRPRTVANQNERGLDQHTANFVDCMRSRTQPICNAEVASLAAINAHLGNIAFRTGGKVRWDSDAGRFEENAEANAMVTPTYRAPWALPSV